MSVYLKYGEDIKGDVTEPAHNGYIELTSAQWAVSRPTPNPIGGSADRERAKPTEIIVTKRTDSASMQLLKEALYGKPVSATIDFAREDGSVYFRIEMSGTMISSFNVSGSGDSAMESLTLNFTSVEFKNNPGTPPP